MIIFQKKAALMVTETSMDSEIITNFEQIFGGGGSSLTNTPPPPPPKYAASTRLRLRLRNTVRKKEFKIGLKLI